MPEKVTLRVSGKPVPGQHSVRKIRFDWLVLLSEPPPFETELLEDGGEPLPDELLLLLEGDTLDSLNVAELLDDGLDEEETLDSLDDDNELLDDGLLLDELDEGELLDDEDELLLLDRGQHGQSG